MRHFSECLQPLMRAGIAYADATALRRIAMTLHRWHELECGTSDDHKSYAVVRGVKHSKADFEYRDDGKPYMETHYHSQNGARYIPIGDRETGAKKRLAAIMARYPDLQAYIQGDPRGAALYILRPGDVPVGAEVDSYYSRGLAVYK